MFALPTLKYSFSAIEPYIDAQTMEIHYSKHHQAYLDNLNKALEKYPDLQTKYVEELLIDLNLVPEEIRTAVRNNGGGYVNHALFWEVMSPESTKEPIKDIKTAIENTFGSFDNFKQQFSQAALNRFGSGWAWLAINENKQLEIMSTANQDSPISEGKKPVLGLDVWEHAYYLKYHNRRQEYIENWWNVVNWEYVDQLYNASN